MPIDYCFTFSKFTVAAAVTAPCTVSDADATLDAVAACC